MDDDDDDLTYRTDFSTQMQQELLEAEYVQSALRQQFAAHYAAYRLSADLEPLPFQDRVRLPLSRAATQDRVSRYAGPFVTEKSPCVVESVEGFPPESAEAMQALLNMQWRDPRYLNGASNVVRASKIIDFGGVAWVFVDWRAETRTVYGVDGAEEELDLDGPHWTVLHPYDIWPDPRATNIYDMRYFYIREELTVAEFKKRVESGQYPDASEEVIESVINSAGIQNSITSAIGEASRFDLPQQVNVPSATDVTNVMQPESERIVCLFHRFDNRKWCVASVNQELLRETPNPSPDGYMPIRPIQVDPDLQGPTGIAPSEGSHGMNRNANSLASAAMEVMRRAGIPTMLMRDGVQDSIMPGDIDGSMYQILTVPDPANDFMPMQKGAESLPINLNGVDFFKYMGEIGGGTTDYTKGNSAMGTPQTATGTQSFVAQIERKDTIPLTLFSQSVNELLALTGLYNQVFLEKRQVIRRIGARGARTSMMTVERTGIQGEFEYSTVVSSNRLPPAQVFQNIGALVNLFGAQPGLLNMVLLAREAAKAAGLPFPDKAVPSYIADPIPVDTAVEMVRLGMPVPVHPSDDLMEFADAFAAAAMEADAAGETEEAQLLMDAARERLLMLNQMAMQSGRGQDVGNPFGMKADDKGGRSTGDQLAAERGAGMDGGSPGPMAPPGRDVRVA